MARRRLEDRIDNFLDDRENLLDLSQELATARAMFEEFIEKVQPDPDSDDYGIHLARTIKLVSTIGTLVDKISKVQSRNALSAAHVLYVRAAIADLFVKWISDPDDREAAIQDLLFRIGGDEDKDPGVVISIPSSANGS